MPDHAPHRRTAAFRFYAELNDFLPPARRQRAFMHAFSGTPSVKDTIEALGVPHTEVDLILVDGTSVGFDRRLTGGERVSVYPVFERLDLSRLTRLRARPLRQTRFILDVHLGKLARYLRMLGFDAVYRNDYDDPAIIARAAEEHRIILTRDRGLLKHGGVTHGYWLRATRPRQQLLEVMRAFDLCSQRAPFTRCLACNAPLRPAPEDAIRRRVPPGVQQRFDTFAACPGCGRVYWPGSHYERMRTLIEEACRTREHPL